MAQAMLTAIDPGLPPTVMHLTDDGHVWFFSDAIAVDKRADPRKMTGLLEQYRSPVVIERVSIFPGEDVSTGAAFVGSMHLVIGICAALQRECYAVPPSVWKRELGVPGKREKGAVRALCEAASARWPEARALIGRDHNRADAALLASWWLGKDRQAASKWRVA